MPLDSQDILVDGCAVQQTAGAAVLRDLQVVFPELRILSCGKARSVSSSDVFWILSGAMSWYGGRKVVLAVDIQRGGGRVIHRERYTISDGRVAEIELSGYGVFN
jgi:hypothetical protein